MSAGFFDLSLAPAAVRGGILGSLRVPGRLSEFVPAYRRNCCRKSPLADYGRSRNAEKRSSSVLYKRVNIVSEGMLALNPAFS